MVHNIGLGEGMGGFFSAQAPGHPPSWLACFLAAFSASVPRCGLDVQAGAYKVDCLDMDGGRVED